jgi:hypothetical protein
MSKSKKEKATSAKKKQPRVWHEPAADRFCSASEVIAMSPQIARYLGLAQRHRSKDLSCENDDYTMRFVG